MDSCRTDPLLFGLEKNGSLSIDCYFSPYLSRNVNLISSLTSSRPWLASMPAHSRDLFLVVISALLAWPSWART